MASQSSAVLELIKPGVDLQRLQDYTVSHPSDASGWFSLGKVYFRLNRPQDSLTALDRGGSLRASSAIDDRIGGSDYVLLGKYEYAIRLFERALQKDPNDQLTRYYLGRALYQQNTFPAAMEAFQAVLKAQPDNIRALDGLALSFAGIGQTAEAESKFERAIAIAKRTNDEPFLHVDFAYLLYENGKGSKAREELTLALAFPFSAPEQGTFARAERLSGQMALEDGTVAIAVEHFERAVTLAPGDSSIHFLLGRAYKLAGSREAADREFEITRKLNESQK